MCVLKEGSQPNSVYSLCTLTNYSYAQSAGLYIAAGHENHGIAIWEYCAFSQGGKVVKWLNDQNGHLEGIRALAHLP